MNKKHHYKIYDFVSPEMATNRERLPSHIIYPQQLERPLYSKHYSVDGERIKTIYFADVEDGKYSHPVVRETYEYKRDERNYFLNERVLTISWMTKGGTWGDNTKVVSKLFTASRKKLDEVRLRRRNIVSDVEEAAFDFGLSRAITDLFALYFKEIGQYLEAGSLSFHDAVSSDSTLAWLEADVGGGVTVRQWLMNKFKIGTANAKE